MTSQGGCGAGGLVARSGARTASCLPTAFPVTLEVFWGRQWVQLEPEHQHAQAWRGSREHLQSSFAGI